jgi:hypothetical protein
VQNTNDLDAKLAYEMWERYYRRGSSPPKRHYDDSGYDSGSPCKLQKKDGAEDFPNIPKLDLTKPGEEGVLGPVAREAARGVDM